MADFKNFIAYRITDPETVEKLKDEDDLEVLLEARLVQDPAASAWRSGGFGIVLPVEWALEERFVYRGYRGATLIKAQFNLRDLPGTVLREEVGKRVAELERREGRKAYKNEYAQLKDLAEAALLKSAFIKRKTVFMLLIDDLILVLTSSVKVAEDCLHELRAALGSLPVAPITTNKLAVDVLTRLVSSGGDEELNLLLGTAASLHAPAGHDGGNARLKDEDLTSEQVTSYLDNDYVVREVQLRHFARGMVQSEFFINDKFVFKRIKFPDIVTESLKNGGDADERRESFDSYFTIVSAELVDLLNDVVEAMGGEAAAAEDDDGCLNSNPALCGDDPFPTDLKTTFGLHQADPEDDEL